MTREWNSEQDSWEVYGGEAPHSTDDEMAWRASVDDDTSAVRFIASSAVVQGMITDAREMIGVA